jgi:5-formyltetrahydrofolate cyclo-ligase
MADRPYQSDKAELRENIRALLASLSADFWKDASLAVCDRLGNESAMRVAERVLVYAPTRTEIDIQPYVRHALAIGKAIYAPRIEGESMTARRIRSWDKDLERSERGVLHPAATCEPLDGTLDVVVVPGLAFDGQGGRLGRGGGFYDRFLQSSRATVVGVCLDEQVVVRVPADELDMRVGIVVSPTRTLRVLPQAG